MTRRENLLKGASPEALLRMCDYVHDGGVSGHQEDWQEDLGLSDLLVGWPIVNGYERSYRSGEAIEYKGAAYMLWASADQHLILTRHLPHVWVIDIRPSLTFAVRPVFGGRFMIEVLRTQVTKPLKYLRFGARTLLRGSNGRDHVPMVFSTASRALEFVTTSRTWGRSWKMTADMDRRIVNESPAEPYPAIRGLTVSMMDPELGAMVFGYSDRWSEKRL